MDEAFPPIAGELRFFGGFMPWVVPRHPLSRAIDNDRLAGYRDNAEADVPATPTFRYWPATADDHHLQQDGALAAHARAASRLAGDAADHVHLLRALEVQAPAAGRFLRRSSTRSAART